MDQDPFPFAYYAGFATKSWAERDKKDSADCNVPWAPYSEQKKYMMNQSIRSHLNEGIGKCILEYTVFEAFINVYVGVI